MKNHSAPPQPATISRREFSRRCALGAVALASTSLFTGSGFAQSAPANGPASLLIPLDQDWLFGGKFNAATLVSQTDDTAMAKVTLPHCVAKLSWQNWDPASWESVWLYRRHFSLPKLANRRVFLKFDGVMVGAKPVFNGISLPEHVGGYLPFQYELTQWLKDGDNILDVAVDARWQSAPPAGSPKGHSAVDYFLPGGICRSVSLAVLPQVFISDVHAKPVNVLQPGRTVDVTVTLNAAASLRTPCKIKVELTDAGSPVAAAEQSVSIAEEGGKAVSLTLSNLGDIKLWDTDSPHLYQVTTTLMLNGQPAHVHRTRIGFREARFTVDGFFLNGKRKQLFGLDRHELYPYVGNAMPPRVMRRDAAILRHDFNCNIVRCSHYPQTEAFLDACDELGLMVWQEPPGWGYLGDEAWRNLVVRDVTEMILRDRNHAAIVIWGVRVNESRNDPPLYRRTTEVAQLLDGTRPTSGSMTSGSRGNWREGWHEDVFAFDDYHSDPDGSVGIDKPTPGVPYMLAETVGQFSYGAKGFNNKYRRAGDLNIQVDQAVFHAQAHEKAARNRNNCGVIAWCAFDYGSPLSSYSGVKCPGVSDVFRIPKLGAAFYLAQTDPKTRPLILPAFYWDFGPKTPRGPGKHAPIFSNCERLEIFVAGQRVAAVQPDRENYSHLQYPPFFCDLDLDGSARPELRIDGYIGSTLSLSKIFSSDPAKDQFLFAADDTELIGDGADATRLAFKVADQYGTERAFGGGEVKFELTGPGILVGDNPFSLPDSGGVGAVWIKSAPKGEGDVAVTATHSVLGQKMVVIKVKAASDAFSS